MSQKIYIVEDDASIRELESYALKSAGFETLGFENSRDFFAQMESHLPDLILLDIMLPGTDGLKVLETIRSTPAYSKLPVILVTAKTGEIDAVKGLDSGADDYITKPFGVMELISRVKALLRRIDRVKKEDLNYGTIRIDVSRHTVQVDGNEVELTYKEYEILKYLMKNRGIVLTRDSLMEKFGATILNTATARWMYISSPCAKSWAPPGTPLKPFAMWATRSVTDHA